MAIVWADGELLHQRAESLMVVIGRSAGQWYMIWISAQLIESEHEGIAVWVLHGVL